MSVLVIFGILGVGVAAGVLFLRYRQILHRAKGIERGLKMVPLLINLPSAEAETEGRDPAETAKLKIAQAEILYGLLAGLSKHGLGSSFYGQRHLALELVAADGVIHFYAAVPVALVPEVTQAIVTAYPEAVLEEVEDHNIFNEAGKMLGTVGSELVLRKESAYPIATYDRLERDPMESLLNGLSSLAAGEGAAVQILLRPADPKWVDATKKLVEGLQKGGSSSVKFTPQDLIKATVKSPGQPPADQPKPPPQLSGLEQSAVEAIEEKARHPGFEVLVRVFVSSQSTARSQSLMNQINNSFALFEAPGLNGFKVVPAGDTTGLITAFIFRFFPPDLHGNILNSVELATLFHLPGGVPTTQVERQAFKQVDGPVNLPASGLLLGYNSFRGVKKEVRLSVEDRRRHTYVVGQTGTGKSTMLENLAVQDMLDGRGFAFIDPHGDTAERLISMVPKNRAEDIIYFNPADTTSPLGLNLFEYSSPEQKDFLIQEAIGMLYKLYDPGHTGIIGPRYEHWFRNAALTLMSDPNGATFIEIPKVFTDPDYLKEKFKYVTDQTVIDFWTQEMAQTSDYHKSEMLGWFVSKFGAFMSNQIMRNIIGQTKSAFDLRTVMDQHKILIVNLSKGQIGELNSSLLGMILVIKFQAAAMGRASTPEDQRPDFCLYVDEFQNFSTDSFATILSEARKYRLNLIVANQFIGQLSDEIRTAVFGNVGTIASFRTGPEDADFLVKQFAPVFDAHDLVNIPNYQAVLRLMAGGLPSQPFTISTLPPLEAAVAELGAAIKQLSAAKFGVPGEKVTADITARLSGKPALAPAPSVAVPSPLPVVTPAAAPSVAPAPPPDHGTLNLADITPKTPPPPPPVPATPPKPAPRPAAVVMAAPPVPPLPPEPVPIPPTSEPAPPPPAPATPPPSSEPTPVAPLPPASPIPVSPVPEPLAPVPAPPSPPPAPVASRSTALPLASAPPAVEEMIAPGISDRQIQEQVDQLLGVPLPAPTAPQSVQTPAAQPPVPASLATTAAVPAPQPAPSVIPVSPSPGPTPQANQAADHHLRVIARPTAPPPLNLDSTLTAPPPVPPPSSPVATPPTPPPPPVAPSVPQPAVVVATPLPAPVTPPPTPPRPSNPIPPPVRRDLARPRPHSAVTPRPTPAPIAAPAQPAQAAPAVRPTGASAKPRPQPVKVRPAAVSPVPPTTGDQAATDASQAARNKLKPGEITVDEQGNVIQG